ncbi:MAG: family 16 glycosylhydrolase [Prolixibacteraceae bacterium]|nr:family 16 glycosylhydrolase [Prolixibacteraceae bacterium]
MIRISTTVILIFFLFNAYSQTTSCDDPVWTDEFDYTGAPASDKWGFDTGGGGWGNQELQTYTSKRDNSWVADGKLFIKAIKSNNEWTSARLVTKNKGDWRYGKIEVRAKIPSGTGVWPAIWMLPTDNAYGSWPKSGEIDIMEHVGYEPNRIYGTVHTDAYNHRLGTQKGSNTMLPTAYTEFHDYAVEWDEEKIVVMIDNQPFFTFKNEYKTSKEWPFDKRFHLVLNIAIGGSWGGAKGIDPNLEEAIMEIEHVRIYKAKPIPVIKGSGMIVPGQEVNYSVNKYDGYQYGWKVPGDAVIVNGQGTETLTVQWGETEGAVALELIDECDTIAAEPLNIHFFTAEGSFEIINTESDSVLWKVDSTLNNTVSIQSEEPNDVRVNFDISSPIKNPGISYHFDTPHDFSEVNEMVFYLKAEEGQAPSNIRIDLMDVNGEIDKNNPFRIDQIDPGSHYVKYTNAFYTGDAASFNIQKVKSIRIYFNYGSSGKKGTGYFVFSPIEMRTERTSAPLINKQEFECWPNPATDFLMLDQAYDAVKIYNLQGAIVRVVPEHELGSAVLQIQHLPTGSYLLQALKGGNTFHAKFSKK